VRPLLARCGDRLGVPRVCGSGLAKDRGCGALRPSDCTTASPTACCDKRLRLRLLTARLCRPSVSPPSAVHVFYVTRSVFTVISLVLLWYVVRNTFPVMIVRDSLNKQKRELVYHSSNLLSLSPFFLCRCALCPSRGRSRALLPASSAFDADTLILRRPCSMNGIDT